MREQFERLLTELQKEGALTFEKGKALSSCSTFHIGGPVAYAVYPKTPDAFIAAYCAAKDEGLDVRALGNASNILFPDEGFEGAILFTTAMCGASFDGCRAEVSSGESVTALAVKAQKKGLAGLEFYYGIPGSVGGAVYMNAGAYEHSTGEVLTQSLCWFPQTGETRVLQNPEHRFDYRHSVYMENGGIVLKATYWLFEDLPAAIRARMDDYMERRVSKQPLELPSAGSVFKRYPGYFTGKLIEEAGLKGYTVGGAQVSTKHAGFIVNIGGATAKDVKELVSYIQDRIYEINGIRIERELIYF